MEVEERLNKLINIFNSAKEPIPGHLLADKFKVTRQIIVKDIAILKAAGHKIQATSRGYFIQHDSKLIKLIAVKHSPDMIKDELLVIVRNGGRVLNVTVEHPVYGEITGNMDIATEIEVDNFVEKLKTTKPLSIINEGIHLHKIEVEDEETFQKIIHELDQKGILLK